MKPRTADNVVIGAVLVLLCTTAAATWAAVHYRDEARQLRATCTPAPAVVKSAKRIWT